MLIRRLLCCAAALIVVGTATPGHAIDKTISAKKLQMKRSASGKETLLFLSKDPLFPMTVGADMTGARIDVFVGNGASHAAFDVPGGVGHPGWTVKTTVPVKYTYRNRQAPAGPSPVGLLLMSEGKRVKLVVKQLGVPLGGIGSVAVRITVGTTRMCTVFSAARATIVKDTASKFAAINAASFPALPDCSAQTLAGAVCGNGIAEPDEDCDGADDTVCPGLCSANCACPPPVCGDDNVNQPAEECDGTDDTACPGECQPSCVCLGVCGDGIVNQPSENCDGAAGGCIEPGLSSCRAPGNPGECTCCGFGFGCGQVGCCDPERICIPGPHFSGTCCYGTLGHACTSSSDCCYGRVCSGGACCGPANYPCSIGAECCSGSCAGNVCQ